MNVFKIAFRGYNWKRVRNWVYAPACLFRGFKYMFQRAKQGWCNADIWNLDHFYLSLFEKTLEELARTTNGAPDKYLKKDAKDEAQPWRERLCTMARCFAVGARPNDFLKNSYKEDYWNSVSPLKFKSTDNGLKEIVEEKETKEIEELKRAYYKEEKENQEAMFSSVAEGFDMLKEDIWSLWD